MSDYYTIDTIDIDGKETTGCGVYDDLDRAVAHAARMLADYASSCDRSYYRVRALHAETRDEAAFAATLAPDVDPYWMRLFPEHVSH